MKRKFLILGIILLIIILVVGGLVYYLDVNKTVPLIEECGGVQECCDNWAKENGVFVITCVGEWEIKDKACVWKCIEG